MTTTAQRKTTPTPQSDRRRGAIATILDPDVLLDAARDILPTIREDFPPIRLAEIEMDDRLQMLIAVDDNTPAVVNLEGVGCIETNGTIGVYICSVLERIRVNIPTATILAAITDRTIDLADGIRTFGARLDSNHHQWYSRYSGPYQP